MENTLKHIQYTVESHIAEVLLDSAPVNCISKELLQELECVVDEISTRRDVRAVVLGSANKKIFCAGADVKQFLDWDETMGREESAWGSAIYQKITEIPVPVICAVNGGAYGGGVELALASDIRVFEKKAKIALPECKLGVLPAYGGTQRLTKLAGLGRAALILFTGEPITGETAYEYNLCEKVCEQGEALSVAKSIAEKIAANSPPAIRAIKQCQKKRWDLNDTSIENEFFGKMCTTSQMREGVTAFLERRKADFEDIE